MASSDGPATYGTASGTMNGSSSVCGSRRFFSGVGNTMRMAINIRMTPPAASSAALSIDRICINPCPANRNATMSASAMSSSRRITHCRRSSWVLRRAVRNSGTLPRGSMTRKNINAADSTGRALLF